MLRSPDIAKCIAAAFVCLALSITPAQAADDDIAAAIAAREHHDYPRAIKLLRSAAANAPADADVLRLLGSTLAFAGQYSEAIDVLERARALFPRDSDIALALSRALLWSGKVRPAQRVAQDIAIIDPANTELGELTTDIAAAARDAPAITLGIAQSASSVSIGTTHRSWYETAATLSVPIDTKTAIIAGVDAEDRSTSTDTRLSLRADRHFGWGTAYVAATATPGASFREQWSVLTGAVTPIRPLLLASIDLKRAHYVSVDVTVVEPGLTLHTADDRWAVTAHLVNLWGERGWYHAGASVRADIVPVGALRLFGGGATYSDTEAGITRTVDSAFVGTAFPISRHLGAEIVAAHDVRHASYSRDGLTLSIHWRFGR